MTTPNNQIIAIWGAGGHAKVVADALRLTGWEVAGFIDDTAPERRGEAFAGAKVLGGAEHFEDLLRGGVNCIAIGVGDNGARQTLGERAVKAGFKLQNTIHPSAVIAADAALGKGVLVAANAVINPAARIGDLAIVNTAAVVEHDCVVEAAVHIAPGAVLTGSVRVGRYSLVGARAVVLDHKTVGRNVRIGAGATVTNDVPDNVTVVGSPACPLPSCE